MKEIIEKIEEMKRESEDIINTLSIRCEPGTDPCRYFNRGKIEALEEVLYILKNKQKNNLKQ